MSREHEAVKPAQAGQDFYAIMSWKGLVTARVGEEAKPVVLRYKCRWARPLVLNDHLKLFIYFCPASATWDVHEASTGIRLAGGGSVSDAVKKTVEFLKESNEDMFFHQMKIMGPHEKYAGTTTEFDTAMSYLKANEDQHKKAAEMRRILEHRKPRS